MSKRIAATYTESLQKLVPQYRKAGRKWPATSREVASWAHRNNLLEPRKKDIIGRLARDLSRAMQKEYYIDPQGRHVRTKHAARRVEDDLSCDLEENSPSRKMLWHDIRTDDAESIITAFRQRRHQIHAICNPLKTDAGSFNDNHPSGKKVQIVFDFEDDLAEMDQPTEYLPPEPSSADLFSRKTSTRISPSRQPRDVAPA